MNHQPILRSAALAIVLAAAACSRQNADDRQTTGTPPLPPQTHQQAVPPPALPSMPAVPQQDTPSETDLKVGVAETHSATTGGAETANTATTANTGNAAGATASPLTTNLPPFEGELQLKTAGKAPESLDYAMKGDKIRLGLSSTPGRNDKGIDAIIDTKDKTATILLNEKKEFVEVDLGKLAQKAKTRLENVDVERTGRTDTVSGRQCEEWKIKDREYQVNACVTKGAPYFDLDALEKQASFKAPSWVHRVVDEGYIPLRVNIVDAKGKSLASSQVTDASRKVEASKFEVPVGYKKVDASKLLGAPK